ncbi:MAG: HAMP domain-containing protein [Ruminococcaceae bacterium]|nr:HAMP domain-containing protein [Oscillospiraceae bacterium]
MLKRFAAGIITAMIFPLFYLLFIGRNDVFARSESIADDLGYDYTLLYDNDDIMFIKSGGGEILGKWKTNRTNGYNYIDAEAMDVFDGELYCVLTEINSKDFMICRRSWLKIDCESGSAKVVYQKEYGNIQNAYSTTLTVSDNKMFTVSSLIEGILITEVYSQTEYLLTPVTDVVVNYATALPDGKIVYSDILNRIYITDEKGNSHPIYEADAAGSLYGLSVNDDGFCQVYDTETGEYLMSTDKAGSGEVTFKSVKLPEARGEISEYRDTFDDAFFMYCAAGVAAGVIAFALMSLKRFPVLLKIAAILILCLGVGGASLYALINSIMEKLHLERSLERACMSAKIIEAEIDIKQFEDIDWSAPPKNDYFYVLADLMEFSGESDRIMTTNNGSYITFGDKNYCWIYPIVDGEIKSGICDQFPVNLPFEKVVAEKLISEYKKVAEGKIGSAACGISDDSFEWVIAVSPMKNSEGEVIALIETGISKLNYMTSSKQNSSAILRIVVIFEAITGALILAAAGITLLPLKKLHKAVEATGNGDYGVSVKVKGRDEIAGIAEAFNVMSMQIYDHTQNLSKLNEAYLRFLPSGIISTIGKPSVLSVSRGDYSSMSGYILHITLNNFSEQTESLSNDSIFELINSISCEIMEKIIAKNGIIESYNQEEYICIFGEADHAYNSAIDLIRQLRQHYPQLKTSFVIVKDNMLLGIVGHEKRLGTIMLSHGIRLSKLLGKIASSCGASLIVTSDISFSVPCPQRLLGKIDFNGYEYTFFDCFGGDDISLYLSKLDGCAQFEEMVVQFYESQWNKCRHSVLSYLERYKNDHAAIRYLFLCENNIKNSGEKADMESMILEMSKTPSTKNMLSKEQKQIG